MQYQKTCFGRFFVDFILLKCYIELTNINTYMNKYQTWYQNITNRARSRTLDGYSERHHVVPRSLGGSDDADNLVDLTAREHFVCHWLLTKMYTGEARYKMINAMYIMKAEGPYQTRYESKITGRVYNTLREEFSRYISNLNKGRVQPPHEKANQKAAITGRKRKPFSQEWLDNMSKAHAGERNGMYNKKHTDEAKSKQREKATGRKQSAETIQKKADAVRGSKREKKLCPHCNQMIAVNTYVRWHGANCKSLKETK
jgi:hypothetical protein